MRLFVLCWSLQLLGKIEFHSILDDPKYTNIAHFVKFLSFLSFEMLQRVGLSGPRKVMFSESFLRILVFQKSHVNISCHPKVMNISTSASFHNYCSSCIIWFKKLLLICTSEVFFQFLNWMYITNLCELYLFIYCAWLFIGVLVFLCKCLGSHIKHLTYLLKLFPICFALNFISVMYILLVL
jgi:hypothetical protein